jgi:hypothetical protein
MKDKVICTVKRSTWARGGKNGAACLRNDLGNMCCLGFLGVACGVEPECMWQNHAGLYALPKDLGIEALSKYPVLLHDFRWELFSNINDEPGFSDTEREEKLKSLAETNGFEFVFVD